MSMVVYHLSNFVQKAFVWHFVFIFSNEFLIFLDSSAKCTGSVKIQCLVLFEGYYDRADKLFV